ncbi:MAG: hypothetical protein H0W39_04510 [Sphingomonas sp.]|nr:hypothetical protein [Sphingomonas sp.]
MKVHPPKAIDSWREFFVEIIIIVIGIAIALGAEEMLSDYHSQKQVAVVQESLDEELSDSLFAARERLKLADCQQTTLDQLDSVAHSNAPKLGEVPATSVRLLGSAAWDAAVASGIVEEMEHEERYDYATLFSIVRSLHETNTRERELWAVVRAYGRTPPATADARHRLSEAVSQLRSLTGTATLASRQFVEIAGQLDLKLSPADLAELREPVRCPAGAADR